MKKIIRPSFVTDEILLYLDALRESGATNMFGAPPFVQCEFGISKSQSKEATVYWMKTFSKRRIDNGEGNS
jgi:hypothetical protein